jgi:hypothetical protein
MIIYWVIHSVCDESIRAFLSELRRDFAVDDGNDNVGFIIQELITRFITPTHLSTISNEFHDASLRSGEAFASFWDRLLRARDRYCMAYGVKVDDNVFLRSMYKGIKHRHDLLDEYDRAFGKELSAIRSALVNIDAGHRRRELDQRGQNSRPNNNYKPTVTRERDSRPSTSNVFNSQGSDNVTQLGETWPVPHNPPRDGERQWHSKAKLWTIFYSNHAKFTNHDSTTCRLATGNDDGKARSVHEHVKVTSVLVDETNISPASPITLATGDSRGTLLDPSNAIDTPPSLPLLPSAEQRRKLPAVEALIEGQTVLMLIDWGSSVNVINPRLVDTSKAIRLGPCAVRFNGALKTMNTYTIMLERVLLYFQASRTCTPSIFECWLCPDVEFAALMAHYTYDSLYSGQLSDQSDNRILTIRETGVTVPYSLVDANVATVRAIQDQAIITWSSLCEVQLPASAHAIVELSPDTLPVSANSHHFELHPDMVTKSMFAVQAHIPVFDTHSGAYAVVVQNMTTKPQVLRQGLCLLISRQTQPVAT